MSPPSLSRSAIAEVDRSGLVNDILDLPSHLRDALWRVESADLEPADTAQGVVVCGMGGSAIGADLAVAALGDRATRPVLVSRDYGLPPWTTPDTTVVCVSCSGNTEETLACYEAASALGAPRIVVTAGGALADAARRDGVAVIPVPGVLQPRAAVVYTTVAVLEVAARAGAAEPLRSEIDVAAARLAGRVSTWGPDGPEDGAAKRLARALHGTVPVVVGAGFTWPVAYRWKTQINENAKQPCFAGPLPEVDHNELEGWQGARELAPLAAVLLDDSDLHPHVRRRIDLTCRIIAPHAVETERIESEGESAFERLFSLVMLGDLVSIYLAVLRGVDPTPVSLIAQLKGQLAR